MKLKTKLFQFSVAAEEDEVEDESVVEDEEVAEGKFLQNSDFFFKENISLTLPRSSVRKFLLIPCISLHKVYCGHNMFLKCSVA